MQRAPVRVFSVILAVMLTFGSAPAASQGAEVAITEEIVSLQQLSHSVSPRVIVTTRLTVPGGARWQTATIDTPLRLTVLVGELAVQMVESEARIDRGVTPLLPAHQVDLMLGAPRASCPVIA